AAFKDAATGIAARYYMNRNYFVADPDAFSVSDQTIHDQGWHNSRKPLSLDDAKIAITLAAVTGGMYEIGDDLPLLGTEPERLALVENQDLIDMARLGRSSTPLDLMTYLSEDEQPSIFLLKESSRQSILTVFNWTENSRTHTFTLASLGLKGTGHYTVTDVFDKKPLTNSEPIVVTQPPHSVRVLKIINTTIPAQAPAVEAQHPFSAATGEDTTFTAMVKGEAVPAITYRWNFGDGVSVEGRQVSHAYTHAGDYSVTLHATGLDGLVGKTEFRITVNGFIPTRFDPANTHRPAGQ
ncbi:MAG TPA: PKD domain-containing protein, partial [Acidobacteriaceae bacterium]|nr:PKD domain-containing protein [Acidobacteriaceae bacterium]